MATVIESLVVELRGKLTNFEKDMSSATSTLQKTNSNISRITNQISTAFKVGIGIIGVQSIKALASGLVNLAEKGEQAGSVVDAFNRLGGSAAAIDQAKTASLGLVNSFDLMAIANRQLLAGLPSVNQNFGQIVEIGTRLADTLGIDTKQAIENLSNALIKGNKVALEKFGFNLDGVKGKADITSAALSQLTTVQNSLAPSGDSVANSIQALSVTYDDVLTKVGIQINNNVQLAEGFRSLATAILQINWQAIITGFATVIELSGKFISGLINVVSFFKDTFEFALINARVKLDQFSNGWIVLSDTVSMVIQKIKAGWNSFTTFFTSKVDKVNQGIDSVTNSFKDMYVKVVGNSYVPDMQQEVSGYFDTLNTDMESGVYDSTNNVSDSFRRVGNETTHAVAQMTNDVLKYLGVDGLLSSSIADITFNLGNAFGLGGGNNSGSLGLGGGSGAGAAGLGLDPTLTSIDIALGLPPGTTQLLSGMLGIDINKELDRLTKNIGNTVSDAFEDVGDFLGFAKGGVVAGPTLGIVGEAGPEAMLPLTKKNGVLGVNASGYTGGSGNITYNIDARGSSAGVERSILNALRKMQTSTIDSTMSQQQDMIDRGFSYGY